MDTLREIAEQAGAAASVAAARALGADIETKGDDRKSEEAKATLQWPIIVGFGVVGALLLFLIIKRK